MHVDVDVDVDVAWHERRLVAMWVRFTRDHPASCKENGRLAAPVLFKR
ncbi:hypothetical protein FHY11_001757 [Xanthomonas arboricola]|nr:hypothetical protein [Xanthomonas euroxanthea]NIK08247.1 hypothetical protein [Xanthomonas euroxanthea]